MRLDFRLAWRGLRRAPATGVVIVGSLALGIGGATIGFSVVQGVLLRALPYEEPARLVAVEETVRDHPDEPWELSYPGLRDLQAGARTLVGLGAWVGSTLNLAEGEEIIPLEAAVVTPNLFQVLRVAPVRGRGFVPDDTRRGHRRSRS